MATKLGLTVLDKGSLSAARELEDFPLKLFPEWRLPLSIAVGLTAFFFFYLFIRDVIYAYVEEKTEISYRIMVSLANKVFPIVALIMLSLCYLPGAIAAFFFNSTEGPNTGVSLTGWTAGSFAGSRWVLLHSAMLFCMPSTHSSFLFAMLSGTNSSRRWWMRTNIAALCGRLPQLERIQLYSVQTGTSHSVHLYGSWLHLWLE
ncbi:hypothetical protein CHARACLAT_003778 [Characodon lateralis]|uniref:Uncharacterized protein n=1 Tax=Characodon lateralis TaxID=208331 RepID=A0ABU7DXG0_9TELE|nr:hypothetical protein [Characodon lateralis]